MKRNEFLKMGIGSALLSLIPGSLFASPKKEILIKKNPVIEFTPEVLSSFNVGMYIINDKANVENNVGYAVTVTWKIVYQMRYMTNTLGGKNEVIKAGNTRGLCNVLTDGWTNWLAHNKEDLCVWLNDNPYGEKFRILTPEELNYMLAHRGNIKQLVRHV